MPVIKNFFIHYYHLKQFLKKSLSFIQKSTARRLPTESHILEFFNITASDLYNFLMF